MATSDVDQQHLLDSDSYSPEEEEGEEEGETGMSLIDHLEELRKRLFICIIAIAVGAIGAFFFKDQIIHLLAAPLPKNMIFDPSKGGTGLVTTGIGEAFMVTLKLSLISGVVIALPVILYEIWAFISPGLYVREKKYAIPFILIGIILFVIGVVVGYLILQYPLAFLVGFGDNSFTQMISANSYFTFVAFLLLIFGAIFELPLVICFLAIIDLVSEKLLKEKRAMIHMGLWLAAVVITPGGDLYSPVILGVCMSILYELSILFVHFAVTPRKLAEAAELGLDD